MSTARDPPVLPRVLGGRSVWHAEAPPPWPPGRPLCDRMLARIRVGLVAAPEFDPATGEGRTVTCRKCLGVLRAWELRRP